MMHLHEGHARGHSRLDWLDSRYSFSFADWHDPQRMGFRTLRVLNEDRIAPGKGFGPHPHRDMEILTVVLEGALEHRDSSGASTILNAGDVQRMSAGRGVLHSEWNASEEDALHLLQIWMHPDRPGRAPSHDEGRAVFPTNENEATGLRLVASQDPDGSALGVRQDAAVYAGRVDATHPVHHDIEEGRGVWIQAVRGRVLANDIGLSAGDALSLEEEDGITLTGDSEGDFLLFDLA